MNVQSVARKRLFALVTAFGLTGLGITFLTFNSQWQASKLRTQLRRVDSESFQVADQFRSFMRQLNEALYHYGRSHTQPDVTAFAKLSNELNLWIDAQKLKLITNQEKVVMGQIDAEYDNYLSAAKELLIRLEAIGEASATMDEYTALRKVSQRLADLGLALSRAHLVSRDIVLAEADHAITELRILGLVSLGLLFVFALALGAIVHRDMIVPLRLRLVECESLRERQEKLVSLGVLAAGVAHEIRNPLTAIKAALFIQQKKIQPGTQEAADSQLIEREIIRLERIVNDFLLFAHPGDSKLALVSADAPVREIQALLAPQLAKDKIQLLLLETSTIPILMDGDQIKQVLINLIRNAAEAIDDGGVIKLRVRSDRRRLHQQNTEVVILEVDDNGKGMTAEVQKRLFDPFFTTKDTGTGLGLSIAARIVQSHRGELEYQTAPGVGTTFGIVLPVGIGEVQGRVV